MSEQMSLSAPMRKRVQEALESVPGMANRSMRDMLLQNLPPGQVPNIARSDVTRIDIFNIVQAAENIGVVPDDGRNALVIVLEEARQLAEGSAPGRALRDILLELTDSPERQAKLRTAFTEYMQTEYGRLDVRNYIPQEFLGLPDNGNYYVSLQEIYVAPLVTVTQYGRLVSTGPDGDVLQSIKTRREHVPLDQVLAATDQPVLVLLGDYVSTLYAVLRHQALRLLTQAQQDGDEAFLPLLVPLYSYAQALRNKPELAIADFAIQFHADQIAAQPNDSPPLDLHALFVPAIRRGRVVYLLDGLSKVGSEQRGEISRRITELARTLAGGRLLLTSQRTGYIPLAFDVHSAASVEPLLPQARSRYIRNWYVAWQKLRSGGARAEERTDEQLITLLNQEPALARLGENHLTLTLLTLLFISGQTPQVERRIDLYELVASLRIDQWADNRPDIPPDPQQRDAIVVADLGPLALWLHDTQAGGQASRVDIRRWLEEQQPGVDPATFMDRYLTTPSVLDDKGDDQWGFSHISSQEYYAARAIAAQPFAQVQEEIARRVLDAHWAEVISLVVAYLSKQPDGAAQATALLKETIVEYGQTDPYEKYLHRHLLLAGRVLADEPAVDQDLEDRIAQQLLQLLLTTDVQALQENVRVVMAQLKGSALWGRGLVRWAVEAVQKRRGLERLGVFAVEQVVRDALITLIRDPAEYDTVRKAAGRAVAQGVATGVLMSDRYTPELQNAIQLLTSGGELREQAVKDLAGYLVPDHDKEFVQTVVLPLLTAADADVRELASIALKPLAGQDYVWQALRPLLTDPNPEVREAVADALTNAPASTELLEQLGAMLNDPITADEAYATLAHWAELAARSSATST